MDNLEVGILKGGNEYVGTLTEVGGGHDSSVNMMGGDRLTPSSRRLITFLQGEARDDLLVLGWDIRGIT